MPKILNQTKADSSSIVPGILRKQTRATYQTIKEKGVQKGFIEPLQKKTRVRFQKVKKSLKEKVMETLEGFEDK